MDDGTPLHQAVRDQIDRDIANRTIRHQAAVSRLKSARTQLSRMRSKARLPDPLIMLANGDSWFDYPLNGNLPSPFQNTDVVAQLKTMGNQPPLVLSVAHHGDATTDELGLPKQERMITALANPDNWGPSGKPDAILFSGGGNDIAGDQFCIFLDYNDGTSTGLNAARFTEALGMVEASCRDLILFRDRYAPDVPIFCHTYDWPIPNGVHPACVGPWLKPSLDFCGWDTNNGTRIAKQALQDFAAMVATLSKPGDFVVVGTQGTLIPDDWANELHPFPTGFRKIAAKFAAALQSQFGGRI